MIPSKEEMVMHFPHKTVREVQDGALNVLANSNGAILEVPTGEGKTAIGMTVLQTAAARGEGPNYYVTPTKTLVEQAKTKYPQDTTHIFGRSEYPCEYYIQLDIEGVSAHDSPCYMLDCKHRVDQITGQTLEPGVTPCAYFADKYKARQAAKEGRIVVCTTAFFLLNRLLVSGWKDDEPANVVLDEVHKLADTARGIFEFTITEYTLDKTIRVLVQFDKDQAKILLRFKTKFMAIARKRKSRAPSLITVDEIADLLEAMQKLDAGRIDKITRDAIKSKQLDPLENRKEIKLLEDLIRNIPRFINSLRYSLEEDERSALNYVVAYYFTKDDPEVAYNPRKRARYHLTFKSYYVAPLIRRALGGNVVGMSATIGNPDVFMMESGLRQPFHAFKSTFLAEKTRIFMPTDTPSLAMREVKMRRDNPKKAMNAIVDAAIRFAEAGHRSLIVAMSDAERVKLMETAERRGLEAISYGNGVLARDAAARFKEGEGQALIGVAAHYAEGIDLPKQIAPVIFMLRPGFAPPDDPQTQFETRRFGTGHCWALWYYRVMLQALQVRGRNIRSIEDVGVCFFVSQQFKRFVFASLPLWLQESYVGNKTLNEGVDEALELLNSAP